MLERDDGQVEISENSVPAPITTREREVAELIAQGLSNEQIAERLVLTPGTVANHVAHILEKMRLQSRVQIAVKVALDRSRNDALSILGLLDVLQQVDSATAQEAMTHATTVLAQVFDAEKVDAFFYDEASDLLVALGTSETPLGRRQQELGLDKVPLSNGGRAVWVLKEKRPYRDGQVENDAVELVGVRRDLGVRSTIAAPILGSGRAPGVLLASSRQPEQFTEDQLQLLQFVAYWLGLVARDRALARKSDREDGRKAD